MLGVGVELAQDRVKLRASLERLYYYHRISCLVPYIYKLTVVRSVAL